MFAARVMEQITMYAVFRSGGKQYRASKGDVLRLEKLDADEGAKVKFDEVLLVGEGKDIKVGSPLLSGGSVSATVLTQGKTKKVSVVKFRRRQNYMRQHTHRQKKSRRTTNRQPRKRPRRRPPRRRLPRNRQPRRPQRKRQRKLPRRRPRKNRTIDRRHGHDDSRFIAGLNDKQVQTSGTQESRRQQ